MELFLLLSMGLSVVAFISIALNQAPANSLTEQNLEAATLLELNASTPDELSADKLEITGTQRETESLTNPTMPSILQPVSLEA